MSVRDQAWPQGTPCWIDLAVDDVDRAAAFYRALFGWDVAEPPPEAGGYRMCMKGDRPAAGLGVKQPGAAMSAWTTYLATDDIEASAGQVRQAGGQVLLPPMDVLDVGRLAIAADPTGAVFGLWQARGHIGSGVVNEHGALIWNEVMTADHEAAARFYTAVFGYGYEDMSEGDSAYLMIRTPGEPEGSQSGSGGVGRRRPAPRRLRTGSPTSASTTPTRSSSERARVGARC